MAPSGVCGLHTAGISNICTISSCKTPLYNSPVFCRPGVFREAVERACIVHDPSARMLQSGQPIATRSRPHTCTRRRRNRIRGSGPVPVRRQLLLLAYTTRVTRPTRVTQSAKFIRRNIYQNEASCFSCSYGVSLGPKLNYVSTRVSPQLLRSNSDYASSRMHRWMGPRCCDAFAPAPQSCVIVNDVHRTARLGINRTSGGLVTQVQSWRKVHALSSHTQACTPLLS